MLNNSKKGFIFLPVLIAAAAIIIGVGGYFYFSNKDAKSINRSDARISATATQTPAPTTKPTLTPTLSPKPIPTKKPITPTVKPTGAVTSCSKFKPEDGLTTLLITLKEKDGKPLIGDWTVKIKPTGSCPGILPPNWGNELSDVVRQPNYTYTSPGLHPGQFRVDVQYYYTGEGFDWDGTSGPHSKEVTVAD